MAAVLMLQLAAYGSVAAVNSCRIAAGNSRVCCWNGRQTRGRRTCRCRGRRAATCSLRPPASSRV
eukprot:3575049-Rhodomonas_salina.1